MLPLEVDVTDKSKQYTNIINRIRLRAKEKDKKPEAKQKKALSRQP